MTLVLVGYYLHSNSTIIVSQLPVANWYDILNGNTTAADAILDRIVHTSKRFTVTIQFRPSCNQTKNPEVIPGIFCIGMAEVV